jgi:hypothetical protein
VAAHVFSLQHEAGLPLSTGAAAGVLLLYPVCRWYRRLKRSRRYAVLGFF